jgi:hypothetical protein
MHSLKGEWGCGYSHVTSNEWQKKVCPCRCQGKVKSKSSKAVMFGVPIPAMQVSEIERGVINAVHRIKDAPVTGSQPFALDQSVGSEPPTLGRAPRQRKTTHAANPGVPAQRGTKVRRNGQKMVVYSDSPQPGLVPVVMSWNAPAKGG